MSDQLVDLEALTQFLRASAPQYGGGITIERIGSGESCLTFLVNGDGWQVVLRRPPRGDLPPSAFDIAREYRVMRALHEHAPQVPVPRPVLLCEDISVIGAPFFLMEKVDGLVVRDEIPSQLSSPEDRARMGEELVDILAALHSVNYHAAGLDSFGKPEGYLERQLRRMDELWQRARFRELPDIDAVGAWLKSNIPRRSNASLVHGDFKLDNVVFRFRSPARLIAVLDWEMSTLGDPLSDVGWMLYFWRSADEKTTTTPKDLRGLGDRQGLLSRRALMERYQERTGSTLESIAWYVALAGWKIAIIMEGSYRRYLSGIGDHPTFANLDREVPELASRARQAMNGELDFPN